MHLLEIFRYFALIFVCDQVPSLILKSVSKRYQKIICVLLIVTAGVATSFYMIDNTKPNFYKELGVKRMFSDAELRKAYREKSIKYHPDKKGGSEYMFKYYQSEYDILRNESIREIYDKLGNKTARMFFENQKNYTMMHAQGIISDVLFDDCMFYLFQAVMLRTLSSSQISASIKRVSPIILISAFLLELTAMYPQGLEADLIDPVLPQTSLFERNQLFKVLSTFLCIAIKLCAQVKGNKKSKDIINQLSKINQQAKNLQKQKVNKSELENHLKNIEKQTANVAALCSVQQSKEKREKKEKLRKQLKKVLMVMLVIIAGMLVFQNVTETKFEYQSNSNTSNSTQ